MGCFGLNCKISGMPILEDQQVVLLFIRPDKIGTYLPVSLPIFGEYDDYGNIKNIVPSKAVEILENFMGITVYEMVKFIISSGYSKLPFDADNDAKRQYLSKWDYMIVDRDVYDVLVGKEASLDPNEFDWVIARKLNAGNHYDGTPQTDAYYLSRMETCKYNELYSGQYDFICSSYCASLLIREYKSAFEELKNELIGLSEMYEVMKKMGISYASSINNKHSQQHCFFDDYVKLMSKFITLAKAKNKAYKALYNDTQ